MQFEIGQMLPSKSDEKIFFKKTIFTNTTSPTVELSNDDCTKRPNLCKKGYHLRATSMPTWPHNVYLQVHVCPIYPLFPPPPPPLPAFCIGKTLFL